MQYDFNRVFNIKKKQMLINNPYDIMQIQTLSKKTLEINNARINKETIIAVGRLEAHKNVEFLIYVFNKLHKLYSGLTLCILGDGPERDHLKKVISNLKLEESIFLFGKVKNPYAFLMRAGIYISCSESEGFPNALVEAMICGLPSVSSDCLSGPREILAPNTSVRKRLKSGCELADYGILCAVKDEIAYTQAVSRLLSDGNLYNTYKKNGIKRAQDFSVEKISLLYKEVLDYNKKKLN